MTTLRVNEITDAAGTSAPDFKDGITYKGSALSSLNGYEYTSSATEPTSPNDGALWWDTTNSKPKIYINNEWKILALAGIDTESLNNYGDRAVTMGGVNTGVSPNTYAEAQYADITTAGNATDFGDLLAGTTYLTSGGVSDSIRGLTAGNSSGSNVIQYITIATTGNATDFGDLITAKVGVSGTSDNTRGLFFGGQNGKTEIDYVTIQTAGNSTDFGDLSLDYDRSAACSDKTYGVVGGPSQAYYANSDAMDYVTIQTTGNSADFGNLSVGRSDGGATANGTYGTFAGGQAGLNDVRNTIDRITIATPGNATDHGDLTQSLKSTGVCGNGTYGFRMGGGVGSNGTGPTDVMDRWTIDTAANAVDHGDLTSSFRYTSAVSGDPS